MISYPQGQTLLRNLDWKYPFVEQAQGFYMWDSSGKRYFDLSGGAFVNCLGHGNKAVISAIIDQMERVAYVNGNYFHTELLEELSEKITAYAPEGLNRLSLLGSGSEAVEAAIKFCRQRAFDRGEEKRTKLIARSPGYHGNTLGALAASARPHYKKCYGPLLSEVPMFQAPQPLYCPVDYETEGAEYYLKSFYELLEKEGPESIFALILEPMSASSCGAAPPPPGYLKKIEEKCREHGIMIIADEVACGAGRMGSFFASVEFDWEPDVIVMGKSLNAGYLPCSALLVRDEDLKILKEKSGAFLHAQTYMQSPVFAACALAVLKELEKNNLIEKVKKEAPVIQDALQERFSSLKSVAPVTGHGFMWGVEFLEDVKSKKNFPRSQKIIEKFIHFAFERSCVLWPNKAHSPTGEGDLFILAPCFNLTDTERTEMIDHLGKTVEEFFEKL